jgi:multisubunit Na+/H+ antiporter MnhG subunit
LWSALGIIMILLLMKMVTKFIGVWPLTKVFYMRNREANYTTLLMATGLTFGTISALFGLQNQIIDQSQYTVLVTVVILSAFVPTLIAQKIFQPTIETMVEWGKIYSERINHKKPRQPAHPDIGCRGNRKVRRYVQKNPCRLRRLQRRQGRAAARGGAGQRIQRRPLRPLGA